MQILISENLQKIHKKKWMEKTEKFKTIYRIEVFSKIWNFFKINKKIYRKYANAILNNTKNDSQPIEKTINKVIIVKKLKLNEKWMRPEQNIS